MFHRSKWVFVASLLGALVLSAGADAPSPGSASAGSARHSGGGALGFTLSEWGREVVLPELAKPAAPPAREGFTGEIPALGDYLADEILGFGAGAMDSERLRKSLANRAIGREDDSPLRWMSSRWKSAPNRFADFLSDRAESRLEALPWVESADLLFDPDVGGDGFGFSASGVGLFHSDESSAFGVQPKIERMESGDVLRGSFGLFRRHAVGESAVFGVNAFADYASDPVKGEISRWRLGVDFASPWLRARVNRHIGGEGGVYREGDSFFRAYVPHGTAAEVQLHSPEMRWLEGFAKFSELEGRGGNADVRTRSFGVTFQPHYGPLAGLRTDAELSGDDANLEFAYDWTLGRGALLPRTGEPFALNSELTNPVVDITPMSITNYEVAALAEEHINEEGDLSAAQLRARISASWELVKPPYMRLTSGVSRERCAPPIYPINRSSDPVTVYFNIDDEYAICDLLHTGMDPNPVLHRALGVGAPEADVIRLLILAGADVNYMQDGMRPLDRFQDFWESNGYALNSEWVWWGDEEKHLEKARVLRANGATCGPPADASVVRDICDVAVHEGWTAYQRELSDASNMLVETFYAVPGAATVAAEIWADFKYLGTTLTVLSSGGKLSVSVGSSSGRSWNSTPARDFVADVYLTEEMQYGEKLVATLRGEFEYYYGHVLDAKEITFTITAVATNRTRDFYFAPDYSEGGGEDWNLITAIYSQIHEDIFEIEDGDVLNELYGALFSASDNHIIRVTDIPQYTYDYFPLVIFGDAPPGAYGITASYAYPPYDTERQIPASPFYGNAVSLSVYFSRIMLPFRPVQEHTYGGETSAGRIGAFTVSEFDDESYVWAGGSPLATVRSNGEIHLTENIHPISTPITVTVKAHATAPALHGVLQFTMVARFLPKQKY